MNGKLAGTNKRTNTNKETEHSAICVLAFVDQLDVWYYRPNNTHEKITRS